MGDDALGDDPPFPGDPAPFGDGGVPSNADAKGSGTPACALGAAPELDRTCNVTSCIVKS